MTDIWSAVGALLLGGIGWFVTSFVGRPIRQFFDLRGEVIHRAVLYDNVTAAMRQSPDGSVEPLEISEDERNRLREAQNAFRDLAARMRAFALNERFAVRVVESLGYDPMEASAAVLGVSNTLYKYGSDRTAKKEALETVLRFRASI